MSAPGPERRRELALAALAASAPERPPGERPTPEEIRRWIDGEVAPARAAEIDAHTALDPELHALWCELRLARLEEDAPAAAPAGVRERPDVDVTAAPPVRPAPGPATEALAASCPSPPERRRHRSRRTVGGRLSIVSALLETIDRALRRRR